MRSHPVRIVAASGVVAFAIWAGGALLLSRPEPSPAVSSAAPQFDAAGTLEVVRELVTRHPRRVLGSLESRQSSGTVKSRFETLGYQVEVEHFDAVIAGRRQNGRNLWAVKPGDSSETIVVVAHYDTAPTTVQGASDNGAAVGVLLELARIWKQAVPRRTLLFLASDGEEWGMLGVRDFVRRYPRRDRIVAALSLDGVAPGEVGSFRVDGVGQFRGYAPPWLRELGRAAAAPEGVPVVVPSRFEERLERALALSWTDQGPFVAAGIPAVNLGSRARDADRHRAVYHSSADTVDVLHALSLERYGRAAERLTRSLVELPELPRDAASGLQVGDGRYLAPAAMELLAGALFLPLATGFVLALREHRARVSAAACAGEALRWAAVAVPLALGYAAVLGFEALRLLPRYELYPATPRDPILTRPYWGVIAGVAAVVAAAALAFYAVRRFAPRLLRAAEFGVSRLLLLGVLLVLVALGFCYNPSWTMVFFTVPAWVWTLVGRGDGPGPRAANRLALASAGVVWYFTTIFFAGQLDVGWKIFWYEILAMSTGTFRPAGVLLAIGAIAAGARLVAIQSLPAAAAD